MINGLPPSISSSRWGARTKRIVVITSLVILAFFIWNARGILPLLIVATLLSYLMFPLVNFIERRVLFFLPFRARSLAVLLSFVVVVAQFVVFIIIIAPVFIDQIGQVGDELPELAQAAERELELWLSKPVNIGGRPILINGEPIIPMDRIREITGSSEPSGTGESFDIFQTLGSFLGSLFGLTAPVFSVLGGAVNFLVNTVFMFVIMFYMMRDGDKFTESLISLTPDSYRGDVRRMLYELGRVWNAYLRGQLILCTAVGFAVYIAALILGLPNAPVLGLLAGFLEFIPNLGPIIASIPAILIALFSQSSTIPFLEGLVFAVVVAAVWMVIQNIEAIVLVPRVMGGSLNLHPVVVILAVIIGASLAGALGVILAAPMTATARVFGQYVYGKVFDANPFPPPSQSRNYIPSRLVIMLLQSYPVRFLRAGQTPGRRIHQPNKEVLK